LIPKRNSDDPRFPRFQRHIGIVTADDAGLIKCEVASPSVDRLAVILPRVVRAALLQGFELVADDGSKHFKSEPEAIGFSITKTVRREKHLLTDAERAKEEAWERKRDLAARRSSWDNERRPDHPEGANEALEGAQCLSVAG
jgi:hypothetical protein